MFWRVVEKRALRQVCGAGVPPALLCPNLLGSRDGHTTIVPRLGGEPKKIRTRKIVPSWPLARIYVWRDCCRSKSSRGISNELATENTGGNLRHAHEFLTVIGVHVKIGARMTRTLQTAIVRYGAEAKAKLHNVAASGEPEDQLRAPLEGLIDDLAELCGFPRAAVAAIGESAIAALKTRPDYAITLRNALVGFIEIKAPGKGADPRRFRGHDKEQWEKLQSLPNLLYTDGNQFSLFRSGQLEDAVVFLKGRYRNIGFNPRGSARTARLVRQLFSLGTDPAENRQGIGKGRRPPLSLAPRRGGRTTGPAKPGPHRAGR